MPLLACAAGTASWLWVGERLNRNWQWAPLYYGCGGEVGPTLSHSWVKLLQTVLIIFRVLFNVKQKCWKLGGWGHGLCSQHSDRQPDRARYCSGVKKATTKAKQMPRDPTSACDRRVAFLLAPTEGQQMGLIQPYAPIKSGRPVIDLRAAVMASLAGARPGVVGRTCCAPAAVARGVTWPSAGGSYRRWNCATRPGPRRNRNTPGSRWTSSIPHTGSGFGPRQGAESEGVHGVFYLRGRPEVASSPCPVLARVVPKAQRLPTSCCAFGIINRGDARESYTEAQDSWITPDMLVQPGRSLSPDSVAV